MVSPLKQKMTIYKDIWSKEPHIITVGMELERIKTGVSAERIRDIQMQVDKERANDLKKTLPCACFSGVFNGQRLDSNLKKYSGFIALDFDLVDREEAEAMKNTLMSLPFIFACWLSPRYNGVKALVRVSNPAKHRGHFKALQDEFNGELDESGINESRVCYESYDPDIYINEQAQVWEKVKVETVVETQVVSTDYDEIFRMITSWLANKKEAFRTGERNIFIFKLACACARYGIPEAISAGLIKNEYLTSDTSFSINECERTVKSAYNATGSKYGSAQFEKGVLVSRSSRTEIDIANDPDFYNPDIKVKDIIYGEDVKEQALRILEAGYEQATPWNIVSLDRHFKRLRGELTVISGIGNYGKSQFWKYLLLLRAIIFGEKFVIFGPEDNPAEIFYHDFVEMFLGRDCTIRNPNRPSESEFLRAYDFVSKHIFYLYPEQMAPTPEYIKERFLEIIIKEKIDGCLIDPFNQMSNDYSKSGGRSDKYLETFLSDITRFGQQNNIYMDIICHPHKMMKNGNNNYPMPDVFDLADGAMWNNKAHNIIIYHRPRHQEDPNDSTCEVGFKKIKKQKITGMKGTLELHFDRKRRRFLFDGVDEMENAISKMNQGTHAEMFQMKPNKNFIKTDDAPF